MEVYWRYTGGILEYTGVYWKYNGGIPEYIGGIYTDSVAGFCHLAVL